ncbi:MAG: GtrA family protein [Oscillospiraceae bacterium]|nr:GtrA family protein [Oscillospiraceae bacterium]
MMNLWKKYRQPVSYLFWGVMTTAVNYGAYFLLTDAFSVHYLWSNVASWVAAVLFAFGVNKYFVFRSEDWSGRTVLPELLRFSGARVASGAVETVLLWLLVDACCLPDAPVKIGVSVLTVILNYVFSKCYVFGRNENGKDL